MKIFISVPCRDRSEIGASALEKIEALKQMLNGYEVFFSYPTEKGWGNAVRSDMLAHPGCDVYVHLDNDFAMPPIYVPALIEAVLEGGDLVIGDRVTMRRTLARKYISKAFEWITRVTLRTKCHENFCGFRAYSARFVSHVFPMTVESHWMFCPECIVLARKWGYVVTEVPIEWYEVRYSRTPIKRQFRDFRDVVPGLFRIIWRWKING